MKDNSMIAKYLAKNNKKNNSRLEFPTIAHQKKHFNIDSLMHQTPSKNQDIKNSQKVFKRDKLDISDIIGARPRLLHPSKSQSSQIDLPKQTVKKNKNDLAEFIKKRQLSLKCLNNFRKQTEIQSSITSEKYQKKDLKLNLERYNHDHSYKLLKTQPSDTNISQSLYAKYKMPEFYPNEVNAKSKASILKNPTFISNLFLI